MNAPFTDVSDMENVKNRKDYDSKDNSRFEPEEKPETLFSRVKNVLALSAVVVVAWLLIASFIDTPEQQFVSAVKDIRKSDERVSELVNSLTQEAKRVQKDYETIKKSGNGARFYSKYIVKVNTGSLVTVELNDYSEMPQPTTEEVPNE